MQKHSRSKTGRRISPISYSRADKGIKIAYNGNLEYCKMFDFIIDMVADIAEIFIDLWVNKVINRKRKVDSAGQ